MHCVLFKMIAEFNQIMGKDMQAIYGGTWNGLMQCVLVVAAKEDSNHHVQEAITLAGQYTSDGMQ